MRPEPLRPDGFESLAKYFSHFNLSADSLLSLFLLLHRPFFFFPPSREYYIKQSHKSTKIINFRRACQCDWQRDTVLAGNKQDAYQIGKTDVSPCCAFKLVCAFLTGHCRACLRD